VYTLALAEADGSNPRVISFHETHEWDPAVLNDGRVIYTRWDYVDRNAVFYQQLWSVRPDGSDVRIFYGNNTLNPVGVWEARPVPGSNRVMATAAAHHAMTAGSIILLDVTQGIDGLDPIERLTPDVLFPESESPGPTLARHGRRHPSARDVGRRETLAGPLLPDAVSVVGGLLPGRVQLRPAGRRAGREPGEHVRDLSGRSLRQQGTDLPRRQYQQPVAHAAASPSSAAGAAVAAGGRAARRGHVLPAGRPRELAATGGIPRRRQTLRIVQVLPKTTPHANLPRVGLANASPGRQVLGTVPVEPDGSAYFRAPAGIPLAFQALDERGMAIQTMRSLTYLQPGEQSSCVGCHEHRTRTPLQHGAGLAGLRAPSEIAPGPDGSRPFNYAILVQPVLDKHCVECHRGRTPRAVST
jgi:hypothetical protein